MKPIAVFGATGAIGGRFIEVVAGEDRAPLRVLVHRWWHTGRIVRFPIELRSSPQVRATTSLDDLASALDGCDVAVSFIDGPELTAAAAAVLVAGCQRAGIRRLVHLGCLTPGEVTTGPGAVESAAARRAGFEQALIATGDQADVEVVVVAAPVVYGPFTQAGAHEPLRLIERGRVAIERGSGPCHVIYVDDVIEAMWAGAGCEEPVRGRLVATGPAAITWVEFYEAFGQIAGRPAVAVLPGDELAALVAAGLDAHEDLRWPPAPSGGRKVLRAVQRRVGATPARPPMRRRLVIPSPEVLAARRSGSSLASDAMDSTAATTGWVPSVDFAEGMRRTEAYLRWADPR